MKVNFNTAQIFKGYSNVIADDIIGENYRLSYMIMKVDNNGSPDLDRLKEIKRAMGLNNKQINDDTLFLSYVHTQDGHSLSFENKALLYGKELKMIQDAIARGYKPSFNFSQEEKLHLKIYTYIASLTRRIMNENHPIYNDGLRDSRLKLLNVFTKISGETRYAYDILNRNMASDIPIQGVAGNFNKLIRKTMKHYFA